MSSNCFGIFASWKWSNWLLESNIFVVYQLIKDETDYFSIKINLSLIYCPFVHTQEQSDVSSSSQARQKLEGLLNKNMRIRMTDGRTLVGLFLCTDRDCNVILGSAQEFLKSTDTFSQGEPRVLGLAMIPGHHVVSIEVEADSLEDTQGFGANHWRHPACPEEEEQQRSAWLTPTQPDVTAAAELKGQRTSWLCGF